MASATQATGPAFGDDLSFTRRPRAGAGGTWVTGLLAGHRFQALVFPDHAEDAGYELGESRISKLWVQRLSGGAVVFNWDRGPDVGAPDEAAARVVAFLAAELAERVFG